MRVYELAKEYSIKSTEFVDTIQSFGHDIKSHLSNLDDIQVLDIREKIEKKKKEDEVAADQNVVTISGPTGPDGSRADSIPETPLDREKFANPLDSLTQEEVDESSELVEKDCCDDKSETEEFNGVEVDEQLNPVDEMEDGEIEIESEETSFGEVPQKEITTAEEETEDATEDWSSMKELARQDADAEWTKKVVEADAKIALQKVIVERPVGFWSWLKGLFS